MAYTKQTWADLPSTTTPISAARLGYMETGIQVAASDAAAAAGVAGTAQSAATAANAAAAAAATATTAANAAAAAAATSAANAAAAAASAATSASGAVTAANGKNKTYYQATMPTGGTYFTGDTWFDSSNGYRIWVYNGSTWADAYATLAGNTSAALTAANGKNHNYYASSTPTVPVGAAFVDGDLWFDTANGNKVSVRNGGAWAPTVFGNAAVANLDAGSITTGTLNAAVVTITNLNASNITTGTLSAAVIASVTLTANNYYSAAAGSARIAIGPNYYLSGLPTIYWDANGDGVVSASDPMIYASVGGGLTVNGGTSMGKLLLVSSGGQLTSGNSGRIVRAGDTEIQISYDGTHSITVLNGATQFVGGITVAGGLAVTAGTITLTPAVSASSTIHAVGDITTDGAFQSDFLMTSQGSGTANLNVLTGAGGGTIKTIAPSTIRIKRDVGDLRGDLRADRLYDIPVRQFKYKPEALPATDRRYDTFVPGFIAEEVHEHYPIVVEFNGDGQIEDWNPRYLVPAMMQLIQDQHRRLLALEAAA